jgi:CPA2 family monovalent cation:H+ antiporter-2
MRRDIKIMVRTRDEAHFSQLMEAGATEVIPDTFEASIMLSSQVLLLMGVSSIEILQEVRQIRQNRYSLLKGLYLGETDDAANIEQPTEILHSIVLQSGAKAVNKTVNQLLTKHPNIKINAVKRHGVRGDDPDPQLILQAGDVLVVQGTQEDVNHFEQMILLTN